MKIFRSICLISAFILVLSETAFAQVVFQPSGCEFRVSFVQTPSINKVTLPSANGEMINSVIAELNPILNDGYAHYFRAECTQVALMPISKEDMIEDLRELVRLNRLEEAKVWIEENPDGQIIGRVRASWNAGQRRYFFDIRRYVSESNLFDAWAGAERFPTDGVIAFFKSVAYRGQFLHK